MAELHAIDIFNSLSDRERIIVTTLEKNVRDLGYLLTREDAGGAHPPRLIDRLRDELSDADNPDGIATIFADFARTGSKAGQNGTMRPTRPNERNRRGDNR